MVDTTAHATDPRMGRSTTNAVEESSSLSGGASLLVRLHGSRSGTSLASKTERAAFNSSAVCQVPWGVSAISGGRGPTSY